MGKQRKERKKYTKIERERERKREKEKKTERLKREINGESE